MLSALRASGLKGVAQWVTPAAPSEIKCPCVSQVGLVGVASRDDAASGRHEFDGGGELGRGDGPAALEAREVLLVGVAQEVAAAARASAQKELAGLDRSRCRFH